MVHFKRFRFCVSVFVFAAMNFYLVAEVYDFDYYVNIALKNSHFYNKAQTNYAINNLQVVGVKRRYIPSLSSSLRYLSNFDNKLQDVIHSVDADVVFSQSLPLGINFSVSLDNNMTIMKLDALKMLYSFSGNMNLSIPFHLMSPSLISYYTYFDSRIERLYDEYHTAELESAQSTMRVQVAQYVGMYLLQKEYLDIQQRQIAIDADELARDEVLLEQGKLSINDFEEHNTARYENHIKLLNIQYKLEQCEQILKSFSLDNIVLSLTISDWLTILEDYISNKHKSIDYQYEMQKRLADINAYSNVANQMSNLPRLNVSVLVKPMSKSNGGARLVDTVSDYWNKTSQYNISVAIGMNIPFSLFYDALRSEEIICKQMKVHELTKQELLHDFETKQILRTLSLELLQESRELSIQNLENMTNRSEYVAMRFAQGYMSDIDVKRYAIQKDLAKVKCVEAELEYYNAVLAY